MVLVSNRCIFGVLTTVEYEQTLFSSMSKVLPSHKTWVIIIEIIAFMFKNRVVLRFAAVVPHARIALRLADAKLRADWHVVMAAVSIRGDALYYAAPSSRRTSTLSAGDFFLDVSHTCKDGAICLKMS